MSPCRWELKDNIQTWKQHCMVLWFEMFLLIFFLRIFFNVLLSFLLHKKMLNSEINLDFKVFSNSHLEQKSGPFHLKLTILYLKKKVYFQTSKSKDEEPENKAGSIHAVAVWRTVDGLRNPEKRERERNHRPSSEWQCAHKATWKEVWDSKNVSTTFICFARLLPGINSLLLISQVYFLRLRLSGKAQMPEMSQCHALLQKRCHREDVSGVNHIQGLCALMGTGDLMPNIWLLLNFADLELSFVCSLRAGWPRETDPHWQTPHEPYVEATWLPCEGEGAGWKPDPDNHPGSPYPGDHQWEEC